MIGSAGENDSSRERVAYAICKCVTRQAVARMTDRDELPPITDEQLDKMVRHHMSNPPLREDVREMADAAIAAMKETA